MFSDEEMGSFGDIASYAFRWEHKPLPSDPMAKDTGNWTLHFKFPPAGTSGEIYMALYGHPGPFQATDRVNIDYSVNIECPHGAPGCTRYSRTRLNTVEIKWKGIEDLKQKFEEWIRGPLTQLITAKRMSTPTLVAANRKFAKTIGYWENIPGKATPEEIEQLKARFDKPDPQSDAIVDDPRAKDRETDYEYMTSDDVRFWNTLADEYEARRTQPG